MSACIVAARRTSVTGRRRTASRSRSRESSGTTTWKSGSRSAKSSCSANMCGQPCMTSSAGASSRVGAQVDEVERGVADLGEELRMPVEPRLRAPPVERAPRRDELAQVAGDMPDAGLRGESGSSRVRARRSRRSSSTESGTSIGNGRMTPR